MVIIRSFVAVASSKLARYYIAKTSVYVVLACWLWCMTLLPLHAQQRLRLATFNASLYRDSQGQLANDLSTPDDKQAQNIAEIIQRVRPDVLLLNEFDYDGTGRTARLFRRHYLMRGQHGAKPIFITIFTLHLPIQAFYQALI